MFKKLYTHKQATSLEEFKKWLENSGASAITIKNYISDIKAFLSEDKSTSVYSPATIKRRNSSIKKYLEFSNLARNSSYPLYVTGFAILLILALVGQTTNRARTNDLSFVDIEERITLPSNTTITSGSQAKGLLGKAQGFVVLKSPDAPYSTAAIHDPVAVNAGVVKNDTETNSQVETILAGKKEVLILDSLVSENSFIYITPKSSTQGQTLYIRSQGEGYFIVSLDSPTNDNITFQWMIDNTEVYHSIY